MRVGLFDSGIGGLTVLNTLRNKYPNNDYIYYGDTLNVPYGNKTKEELINLADKNMEFLLSKNVDMVIIACGTVSSNCLDYLKSKYDIPIMSIIEPTIKYLNDSELDNILVIATKATIESHIFKNNIKKNIYEVAIPELASLIEDNNFSEVKELLPTYLNEYIGKVNNIVLGCTHYPIVSNIISDIFNNNINIIDMSTLLDINNDGTGKVEIYFSRLDYRIKDNIKKIVNNKENIISDKEIVLVDAKNASQKALIYALLPYIMFVITFILSGGSFSSNDKGIMWLFYIFYIFTLGIPFYFISIIKGLNGLKTDNKITAIIALVLDIIPLVIYLITR